jgi:hypothetical protein
MVNRGLLLLLLAAVAIQCSGCATILGGIIGYQSAELCAGLAIGAAVDFGDDVVRGIGQMTAKEENFCRDFNENAAMNANTGEITLPINPFNRQRVSAAVTRLQNTFEKNGWSRQLIEKEITKPFILGSECWYEKWACTTAREESFELEINFKSDRNTVFRILNCSEEKRVAITNQLYQWLQNNFCSPCAS